MDTGDKPASHDQTACPVATEHALQPLVIVILFFLLKIEFPLKILEAT